MTAKPNTSVPGWAEYMHTLRELQANHLMTPAAVARMVTAGKALGMAAFDAGADAMEAAAAALMREHRNAGTTNTQAPHYPGTCRGPDVCPHDWKAPGALPAPCRVCGGRDPLPF